MSDSRLKALANVIDANNPEKVISQVEKLLIQGLDAKHPNGRLNLNAPIPEWHNSTLLTLAKKNPFVVTLLKKNGATDAPVITNANANAAASSAVKTTDAKQHAPTTCHTWASLQQPSPHTQLKNLFAYPKVMFAATLLPEMKSQINSFHESFQPQALMKIIFFITCNSEILKNNKIDALDLAVSLLREYKRIGINIVAESLKLAAALTAHTTGNNNTENSTIRLNALYKFMQAVMLVDRDKNFMHQLFLLSERLGLNQPSVLKPN